jgi:hypothetical protein
MPLNGKNNNIYHIHIKSCVLHAKSHVSLSSYYGSTCQKMTPVIPRGLTPATQEHYLQSYILQCQQKKTAKAQWSEFSVGRSDMDEGQMLEESHRYKKCLT